jgi:hypothetical protein
MQSLEINNIFKTCRTATKFQNNKASDLNYYKLASTGNIYYD